MGAGALPCDAIRCEDILRRASISFITCIDNQNIIIIITHNNDVDIMCNNNDYMDETAAAYFSRILNEFATRSAKFCGFVVHRVH